jgi:tRNA(Ile)-lysidine synthase
VVVGCSGGPDSVVLAHITMSLAREDRIGPVTLVYVDHGLRAETAGEARLVEALAGSGGARCRSVAVEVPRDRPSLEDAARVVRHQALNEIADELDAVIALAHTASDQAETVLMRIVRGTGVVGLVGIPRRRGRIVRPLLDVWREQIESYVEQHGLQVCVDPMNQDHTYLRVRVREALLPLLRDENPQLDHALVRLGESARELRVMVDDAARDLLDTAEHPGAGLALDVRALLEAPLPVRKRALALAAERAGGRPIEAPHLEALEDLCTREVSGTVSLDLPGLKVSRIYGVLRLGEPELTGEKSEIEVRGLAEPYEVRRWRPGDRMRPMRLKGRSRKLSDLFTDAKVPREQRVRARIVTRSSDGVILWAEHIGPAWNTRFEVVLTQGKAVATNKQRQ